MKNTYNETTEVMHCTLSIQQLLKKFEAEMGMTTQSKRLKEVEIGQRQFENKIEARQTDFQNAMTGDMHEITYQYFLHKSETDAGLRELSTSLTKKHAETLLLMRTMKEKYKEKFIDFIAELQHLNEIMLELNMMVSKNEAKFAEIQTELNEIKELKVPSDASEGITTLNEQIQNELKNGFRKLDEKIEAEFKNQNESVETLMSGFETWDQDLNAAVDKVEKNFTDSLTMQQTLIENIQTAMNDNKTSTNEALDAESEKLNASLQEAKTSFETQIEALNAESKKLNTSLEEAKTSFETQIATMQERTKSTDEALDVESKKLNTSLEEAKTLFETQIATILSKEGSLEEEQKKQEENFKGVGKAMEALMAQQDIFKTQQNTFQAQQNTLQAQQDTFFEQNSNFENQFIVLQSTIDTQKELLSAEIETEVEAQSKTLTDTLTKKIQEMNVSHKIEVTKQIGTVEAKLLVKIPIEIENKLSKTATFKETVKQEIAAYIKDHPELLRANQSLTTNVESLEKRYKLMNERLEKAQSSIATLGEKPLASLKEQINTLDVKNETLETKLFDFKSQLMDLERDIQDLQSQKPSP